MAAKTLSPTVSTTTLSHINSLIIAALTYEQCMVAVRLDYINGAISKENAKVALATGYVHHISAKWEAEIKALDHVGVDKMSTRERTTKRNELVAKVADLKAQRDPETGRAVRSSALERRVDRDIAKMTDVDKVSTPTANHIVLTPAQRRLFNELDGLFETYAEMRSACKAYIDAKVAATKK